MASHVSPVNIGSPDTALKTPPNMEESDEDSDNSAQEMVNVPVCYI